MHATLTEHARCLYGDEYRIAPECGLEHREQYFIEELTFADADSILAMLHGLSPHLVDGYLPVWIRTPPGQQQRTPARLIPGLPNSPGFDVSHLFRRFSNGSLAFVFPVPT